MPSTNINATSGGDNIIVPASLGQQVVVYGFLVSSTVSGGAVGTWKSGAASDGGSQTPLCGIGPCSVAGGGAVLPIPPRDDWFRTKQGESLNLNCTQTLVGMVRWSYFPLVVPPGNSAGV